MTSVKLINHSSSTADWNYYEKIIFICAYCNDDLQLLEKRNRRQPQPKSRIIRNRNVADPRRIDL